MSAEEYLKPVYFVRLARALAVTAGAQLVRGNFASWQSAGHLGDMLAAMRDSFADAAASRPAVLVIDEIDSVGSRSEPDPRNANYNRQVVNAFLEQLDRISEIPGVIVIGTCNAPQTIDAAVLRPGPFDVLVEVPLPGRRALRRMLQNDLPEQTVDADLDNLARASVGKTAADIEGALRAGKTDRFLFRTSLT
ncbi:AAA family ATPase [Roseovarius sp. S4756]|uniref:AAA family ATPase n=1 Tax=Roseovarius maritimus TaxID=3342637 RepID=UPI0037295CD7